MARVRRAWIAAVLIGVGLMWTVSVWSTGRLPVAAPIVVARAFVERADTIRRDQTLSELFARHHIVGADMLGLLRAAVGLNPRRVPAGQVFDFRYVVGDPQPERVRLRLNDDTILELRRDAAGAWRGIAHKVVWTIHRERVSGEIRVSLDRAMDRLVPDSVLSYAQRRYLVDDLASGVFAWVIDFTRDIYEGDGLHVVYERLVSSENEVRFGRVLAARIESRGSPQYAYLLADPNGRNAYYDETGRSLRRAFLRYPVSFRRISSRFNRSRRHPVLHTRRPHLGVDYAADRGTPVYATGEGTVVRANRWGGYGNVVVIRHARDIETRYAHLSGFAPGMRPGRHVEQDQMIGYVGMTGLANGPHVHYEFLQHGRHLNPRTVDFGDGDPVPAGRRAEFDSVRAVYDRSFPARDDRQRVD